MKKSNCNLPTIDIKHIPFSRYGSYIGVSHEQNMLVVYNARLRCRFSPTFEITFYKNGEPAEIETIATPTCCKITSKLAEAVLYIKDDYSLVIKSHGFDICVNQISMGSCYGAEYGNNEYRTISVLQNTYTLFHIYKGKGQLTTNKSNLLERRRLNISCDNDEILFLLTMDKTEPDSITTDIDCDKDLFEISSDWNNFYRDVVKHYNADDNYSKATWYNMWSSFARARDVYHYDTMLMSKKRMSSVWSWDHCFNALAVCKMDPQIALEQFYAPFVLQDKNGALPDMWNPDNDVCFGVTKPPIHGWCFSKLMDNYEYSNEVLEKVYNYLEKWTNWWFKYRDSDNDGIPDYPQGCDSGWDNSTIFDIGYYIESPDLSAFLILQMKCLAKISKKLNNTCNHDLWNEKAEKLLERLYRHNWVNDKFVAKLSTSHEFDEDPTSLLVLMPIVLGEYLDKDKMSKLVNILEANFLTDNGVATEAIKSNLYDNDGYWRGPIWAPTTYLLIDGLRNGGYTQLAEQIAKSFCNMAKNLAHGNYENFDAITGVGLRAPGYTWTASVYCMLINEYDNK